jgi:hypothetical protein
MQKAMLNRQQQRTNRASMAPPIQTVNPITQAGGPRNFAGSPAAQPTPPSQHSSPSTARSPGFALQGGMTSPATDMAAQQPQQARPLPPSHPASFQPQPRSQLRSLTGTTAAPSYPPRSQPESYYPASFQKHYTQLGKLTRSLFSLSACGALFVLD